MPPYEIWKKFSTKRIRKLNQAPEFEILNVQPDKIAQKVFTSLYDGITTSEIDTLSENKICS